MFNTDAAFEAFHVLQKHLDCLLDLAGDIDGNPKLNKKAGRSWDQLKEMGDAYGLQAKEEVNKT